MEDEGGRWEEEKEEEKKEKVNSREEGRMKDDNSIEAE